MSLLSVRALAPALALAVLGTSACTPLRTHQGYVADYELVSAIQPGVDNRDSVLRTLGRPTLTGQFNDNEWYYIARESRNFAYSNPRARDQLTLRVRFDANGSVAAVERTGLERVASINPSGETTPTLGRRSSFFQDLFGNIGTVGAPGMGGQPGGGQGP